MNNAQLRFVFDNKKQASDTKTGLLQIEVRITGSNKRKTISTGVHLLKNQFSIKSTGFVCKNHDNAPGVTGKVTRMFRQIEAFVLSEKCKNLEDVNNWNKVDADNTSVIEFIRNELRKKNPSFATLEHHNVLIRKLEEFGKIKTFSDLTYSNISEFDSFLRKTIQTGSTLNKRHSTFRHYIKQAIHMDLLNKDPYNMFKMPSKKSKTPVFLDEIEMKKILDFNPGNEKLQHTKDLFVFQMFTGLAYIDMVKFTKEDIREIEGKKVIRSSREKTDESFVSLLLPDAENILAKYEYNLPMMSNQKYNDYLKLLGTGAGLKKNITSHVARHTFATYLLNKDIPIESVSRAMGHSNIKMTQHYAKMLGKKVVSDMSKLLE
jgi:site-specific recombinase XerD